MDNAPAPAAAAPALTADDQRAVERAAQFWGVVQGWVAYRDRHGTDHPTFKQESIHALLHKVSRRTQHPTVLRYLSQSVFSLVANLAMRRRLVDAGFLDVALTVLRTERDMTLIASLCNVLYDDASKRKFCGIEGANAFLVELLGSDDVDIQCNVARGMYSYCTLYEQKLAMFRAGATPRLLHLMATTQDSAVLTNVAGVLANIAIHPECKAGIMEQGALGVVANLLRTCRDNAALAQIVRVAFSLSAATANRSAILAAGIVDSLRTIMARDETWENVRLNVLGTIKNFMEDHPSLLSVLVSFDLGRMLASTDGTNGSFVLMVLDCMYILSTTKTSNAPLMGNETLRRITETLRFTSENGNGTSETEIRIRTRAAATLSNLTLGNVEAKRTVAIEYGGLAKLVVMMHEYEDSHAEALRCATRAVFALMATDEIKDHFLQMPGELEFLVRVADGGVVGNEGPTHAALGSLANLAAKHAAVCMKNGALWVALKGFFRASERDTHEQAARALHVLSRGVAHATPEERVYAGHGGHDRRLRDEFKTVRDVSKHWTSLLVVGDAIDAIDEPRADAPQETQTRVYAHDLDVRATKLREELLRVQVETDPNEWVVLVSNEREDSGMAAATSVGPVGPSPSTLAVGVGKRTRSATRATRATVAVAATTEPPAKRSRTTDGPLFEFLERWMRTTNGKRSVVVRRSVLLARSDYFGAFLDGNWNDSNNRVFSVDVPARVLGTMAYYLYFGKDEWMQTALHAMDAASAWDETEVEFVASVLRVANAYGIEGLRHAAEWSLISAVHKNFTEAFANLVLRHVATDYAPFVQLLCHWALQCDCTSPLMVSLVMRKYDAKTRRLVQDDAMKLWSWWCTKA